MKIINLKNKYVPSQLTKSEFNEIIYNLYKYKDNLFNDFELNEKQLKDFEKILKIYKEKKEPIAYIFKNKYFYKYNFYINKYVLIPRFETELIVEEALNYDLNNKNLFDICCGSGCIGITIKKLKPSVNLFMSDICKKALSVANINLKKHSIKAKIFCANFLEVFGQTNEVPDLIIINPPYIDFNCSFVDDSVKKFEPKKALFAKEKGYEFFNILFKSLNKLFELNKNLKIICEFGFNQKEKLEKNFKPLRVKYNIRFKKDYSDNWRIFVIELKE